MMSNIEEVVIQTIAKMVNRGAGELNENTRLAEDLMLKSVSRIELAALLEDQLQVAIANFDILKPRTIGDIIAMLKAKTR